MTQGVLVQVLNLQIRFFQNIHKKQNVSNKPYWFKIGSIDDLVAVVNRHHRPVRRLIDFWLLRWKYLKTCFKEQHEWSHNSSYQQYINYYQLTSLTMVFKDFPPVLYG